MKKKTKAMLSKNTYYQFLKAILNLLDDSKRIAAQSVNSILTATYWQIGKHIYEYEQKGKKRADYGTHLIRKLSQDLTEKYGRGFSERNIEQMRAFYRSWSIPQTLSAESSKRVNRRKTQTVSAELHSTHSMSFPLSWSHYIRLLSVEKADARVFYEAEAIRGGWSVRQLDRQISTLFYERTALSKNKKRMLQKGRIQKTSDILTPEEEIRDPYFLEFLNLKDEYSESDLEEALILHLEKFLLELGGDFTFVGRQKRLKIGDQWFRVDLVFFHRRLRSLVVVDLKIGKFTHADAGQMHLYLNYAKEHWTHPDENPPVGLILCAEKNSAVAKYALAGLPNKVLAAEYKTKLPKEKSIVKEIQKTQKQLDKGLESRTKKK